MINQIAKPPVNPGADQENRVVLWEHHEGRLVKWIEGDRHTIVWSARRGHYPHPTGCRVELVLATFTGQDGCTDGERAYVQATIRRLQEGRVCYKCLRTLEWDSRARFYFCPARP